MSSPQPPCATCGTEAGVRRRRGLCNACYENARRRRLGTPERPNIGQCSECGTTEAKRYARGKCMRCYEKDLRRAKGIGPRHRASPIVCADCGKTAPQEALGLCSTCYHRQKKRAARGTPRRTRVARGTVRGIWEGGRMTHWNASGEWPWTCPVCRSTFEAAA